MRALIVVGLLALFSGIYLVLLSKLQEHRKVDRPLRIGQSFSWFADVLRASDYTEAGRRVLPWYIATLVAMVVAFAAVFFLV